MQREARTDGARQWRASRRSTTALPTAGRALMPQEGELQGRAVNFARLSNH